MQAAHKSAALLTPAERKLYDRCVETISAGLDTAAKVFNAIHVRAEAARVIAAGRMTTMEVGRALAKIKDSQLYRETCDSWAEFVRRNLKVTLRRADQLVVMARKDTCPSLEILPGTFPVSAHNPNAPTWESRPDENPGPAPTKMDAIGQALDGRASDNDEAPRRPAAPPGISAGKARIAQHIAALRRLVGPLSTAPMCVSALDALEDALAAAPELIGA